MRVLVITDHRDSLNAVRPEGELFRQLHLSGQAVVDVMTPVNTPYIEQLMQAGIRIIDFHPAKKIDRAAVARIRKELQTGHYDILHLFNNKAITNGIRAAKDLPVKVLTYRGYTGNVHWWDPTAYTMHLHPRVVRITCVSEAVREVFDHLPFFPKEKAVTVSKGHDPAWYADVKAGDLSEFKLPCGAVVVSIVANARSMKGIPYLLKALTLLPQDSPAHFLLMGRDLDDKVTVRTLEQSGQRRRVTFTGFRRDVLSLVKACDLSLLPSVKGEGLSKVLLESLFLGRPTIMTDIGGNQGLAIPGETALVIEPREPEAMAAAIQQLVSNVDWRAKLGAAGQSYIEKHYTVERSVSELIAVYREVLKV